MIIMVIFHIVHIHACYSNQSLPEKCSWIFGSKHWKERITQTKAKIIKGYVLVGLTTGSCHWELYYIIYIFESIWTPSLFSHFVMLPPYAKIIAQWQGLAGLSGMKESWTEKSTELSLMKPWSRAPRTWDWAEGSPSKGTMTLSTQPRLCKCPWVAQPEPWLGHNQTPLETPWEDLQWKMAEIP